jgi:hypothetical protein
LSSRAILALTLRAALATARAVQKAPHGLFVNPVARSPLPSLRHFTPKHPSPSGSTDTEFDDSVPPEENAVSVGPE